MTALPTGRDRFLIEILGLEPILRSRLRRYAASNSDLEDLLQETYVRLLAMDEQKYESLQSVQAFALTIARNLALDWLRNRQVVSMQAVAEIEALDVFHERTRLEALVAAQQEIAIVQQAMNQLPRKCRTVFALRKVYGLSQREIAVKLGISENTVEQHLVKAVKKMRELLTSKPQNAELASQSSARGAIPRLDDDEGFGVEPVSSTRSGRHPWQ